MPDHVRVADAIREAVEGGLLEAGDNLASRPELAKEHEVSVAAVSRALRLLIDEGLIAARQPQGYFVRPAQAVTQGTMRRLLADASDLFAALESTASPEIRLAIRGWRQRVRRAGVDC
jgi:DNA-binding GntR family transcriptional regulator